MFYWVKTHIGLPLARCSEFWRWFFYVGAFKQFSENWHWTCLSSINANLWTFSWEKTTDDTFFSPLSHVWIFEFPSFISSLIKREFGNFPGELETHFTSICHWFIITDAQLRTELKDCFQSLRLLRGIQDPSHNNSIISTLSGGCITLEPWTLFLILDRHSPPEQLKQLLKAPLALVQHRKLRTLLLSLTCEAFLTPWKREVEGERAHESNKPEPLDTAPQLFRSKQKC